MEYELVKNNPAQFLSLTSLYPEEFLLLLHGFEPYWEQYYRHHTLEGARRKVPSYKEHRNSKLYGTAQKLFFLLVYLKNNPLQTFQAAGFGVSQPTVSKIIRPLLEILDKTLLKMKLSPCRDGQQLRTLLANHPDKVFICDGTERTIQRNADQDAQEEEYSGKKKAITSKI